MTSTESTREMPLATHMAQNIKKLHSVDGAETDLDKDHVAHSDPVSTFDDLTYSFMKGKLSTRHQRNKTS